MVRLEKLGLTGGIIRDDAIICIPKCTERAVPPRLNHTCSDSSESTSTRVSLVSSKSLFISGRALSRALVSHDTSSQVEIGTFRSRSNANSCRLDLQYRLAQEQDEDKRLLKLTTRNALCGANSHGQTHQSRDLSHAPAQMTKIDTEDANVQSFLNSLIEEFGMENAAQEDTVLGHDNPVSPSETFKSPKKFPVQLPPSGRKALPLSNRHGILQRALSVDTDEYKGPTEASSFSNNLDTMSILKKLHHGKNDRIENMTSDKLIAAIPQKVRMSTSLLVAQTSAANGVLADLFEPEMRRSTRLAKQREIISLQEQYDAWEKELLNQQEGCDNRGVVVTTSSDGETSSFESCSPACVGNEITPNDVEIPGSEQISHQDYCPSNDEDNFREQPGCNAKSLVSLNFDSEGSSDTTFEHISTVGRNDQNLKMNAKIQLRTTHAQNVQSQSDVISSPLDSSVDKKSGNSDDKVGVYAYLAKAIGLSVGPRKKRTRLRPESRNSSEIRSHRIGFEERDCINETDFDDDIPLTRRRKINHQEERSVLLSIESPSSSSATTSDESFRCEESSQEAYVSYEEIEPYYGMRHCDEFSVQESRKTLCQGNSTEIAYTPMRDIRGNNLVLSTNIPPTCKQKIQFPDNIDESKVGGPTNTRSQCMPILPKFDGVIESSGTEDDGGSEPNLPYDVTTRSYAVFRKNTNELHHISSVPGLTLTSCGYEAEWEDEENELKVNHSSIQRHSNDGSFESSTIANGTQSSSCTRDEKDCMARQSQQLHLNSDNGIGDRNEANAKVKQQEIQEIKGDPRFETPTNSSDNEYWEALECIYLDMTEEDLSPDETANGLTRHRMQDAIVKKSVVESKMRPSEPNCRVRTLEELDEHLFTQSHRPFHVTYIERQRYLCESCLGGGCNKCSGKRQREIPSATEKSISSPKLINSNNVSGANILRLLNQQLRLKRPKRIVEERTQNASPNPNTTASSKLAEAIGSLNKSHAFDDISPTLHDTTTLRDSHDSVLDPDLFGLDCPLSNTPTARDTSSMQLLDQVALLSRFNAIDRSIESMERISCAHDTIRESNNNCKGRSRMQADQSTSTMVSSAYSKFHSDNIIQGLKFRASQKKAPCLYDSELVRTETEFHTEIILDSSDEEIASIKSGSWSELENNVGPALNIHSFGKEIDDSSSSIESADFFSDASKESGILIKTPPSSSDDEQLHISGSDVEWFPTAHSSEEEEEDSARCVRSGARKQTSTNPPKGPLGQGSDLQNTDMSRAWTIKSERNHTVFGASCSSFNDEFIACSKETSLKDVRPFVEPKSAWSSNSFAPRSNIVQACGSTQAPTHTPEDNRSNKAALFFDLPNEMGDEDQYSRAKASNYKQKIILMPSPSPVNSIPLERRKNELITPTNPNISTRLATTASQNNEIPSTRSRASRFVPSTKRFLSFDDLHSHI